MVEVVDKGDGEKTADARPPREAPTSDALLCPLSVGPVFLTAAEPAPFDVAAPPGPFDVAAPPGP